MRIEQLVEGPRTRLGKRLMRLVEVAKLVLSVAKGAGIDAAVQAVEV
jgi:hypothetical protein